MKKKSYWLSISVFVLILIWTVYYYAMQYTGGFADLKDSIVKAKLFCPEIAGLFCRIAGLFCHDSRANLSLKPVCFGIAIS